MVRRALLCRALFDVWLRQELRRHAILDRVHCRVYGPHVPIPQSTWQMICDNQDSGSGFEVTEAILEHYKLLPLSTKQVTPVAHLQ